jgi:predicted amidohydrolase
VKAAAYQAPLLPAGSVQALDLIRDRVKWCEREGVSILCCPEAILGGLADNDADPFRFAIDTEEADWESQFTSLASDQVSTIIGFTERRDGSLFNTAAILQKGKVAGMYRKLHPAIRRSVYAAGTETPVFQCGSLVFGVVICYDSAFREHFQSMVLQGATAVFIPTNCSLPPNKGGVELVSEARQSDIARAREFGIWVIRADVAGTCGGLTSFGSSGIVAPGGIVMQEAEMLRECLLSEELDTLG